jgi:hypothetical protein
MLVFFPTFAQKLAVRNYSVISKTYKCISGPIQVNVLITASTALRVLVLWVTRKIMRDAILKISKLSYLIMNI